MLKNIQALPGAECHASRDDRNGNAGAGQRGPDVRGHVVRPFHRVPESLLMLRHQLLEEVAHIERHVRVRVLLHDKGAGCVLHECGQQPVGDLLFRKPLFHRPREWVQTLAAGRDREGSLRNHFYSVVAESIGLTKSRALRGTL